MAKYTTDIPFAREALLKIAQDLEAKGATDEAIEIREIVDTKMIRRPGLRRAPQSRAPVSNEIREKVIHDLRNTDLPQEEIARNYNIDGGRVSEINRSLGN